MSQKQFGVLTPILASLLLLAACSSAPPPETAKEEAKQPPAAKETAPPPAEKPATPAEKPAEKAAGKAAPAREAPAIYKVRFETSAGPFVVEVHRDWAPVGAQRFYELVKSGYYNNARFFRVLPNFVVQFGLAASPAVTQKWNRPIKDDEVTHTNRAGSLTFATAGPNTRTTQVFINLQTNQSLDSQGFAPFGMVTEGMDVVQKFYSGYGESPDQEQITRLGNQYLTQKFPKLDFIRTAKLM